MTTMRRNRGLIVFARVAAVVVALAVVAGVILNLRTGEDDGEAVAQPKPTVRIGVYNYLPGWSYQENGEWKGFSIELVKWLAQQLGFQPQYVEIKVNERDARLQPGAAEGVDMVVANFSMTEERRQKVEFAGPYFYDRAGLFSWEKVADTFEDLRGQAVCVPEGSRAQIELKKTYGAITSGRPTIADCFDELKNPNNPTFFVSTDQSILEAYANHWNLGKFRTTLFNEKEREEYGIGFPEGDTRWCPKVAKALPRYLSDRWKGAFGDNLQGITDEDVHRPDPNVVHECS